MDNIAAINSRVAHNLRLVRSARDLTLDQLAKKSGVSKGMLVQIEQGRTNPSVATLCRIANALGVTVSRFVETAPEPAARLIPASQAIELWRGPRGSSGRLLVGFDSPSLMEVWDWDLVPGEWYDGLAHPKGTREVLYIQKGELTLSTEGDRHKAKTSDILMFQADRPHRYANEGAARLRFLMVVTEPSPTAGMGSRLRRAAPAVR
jgi:transcriptional regulator with XRE-family HTH domain